MKQFLERSLLLIMSAICVVLIAWQVAEDTNSTENQAIVEFSHSDALNSNIPETETSVSSSDNTESKSQEKEETTNEIKVVTGIVTEKQYEDSVIMFMPATLTPHKIPEKYLVTITYNDLSETFDDKTLYYQVNEGDNVDVMLLYGKKLKLLK